MSMKRVILAVALLVLSVSFAAADSNIAFAAKITASPAIGDNINNLIDDNPSTSCTFEVGTAGEGTITFTFDTPRQISAVNVTQNSEIYKSTVYVIEADTTGDGVFDTKLAEKTAAVPDEWDNHTFAPINVVAIRVRSVEGVSRGRRAHPALGEVQIFGQPLPDDYAKAAAAGVTIPHLAFVRDIERTTNLVVNGKSPAIIAPAGEGWAEAAKALAEGLAAYKPAVVSTIEAADPANRTVIALGNMLNNPLIERLYWNRYTFPNATVPGENNYLIHTVYDPYPYNGGNNIIVIGASKPAGAMPGVEKFLNLIADDAVPYGVTFGPGRGADAAAIAALKSTPDPTFTEVTNYANLYLQTGEEAYARQAVAAMEIMAEMYVPGGERSKAVGASTHRKMPWNEETTSWEICCVWDAFEECPLISDQLRLDYSNAILQFTRDLISHVSGYGTIGTDDLVTWNHTTFPLLGVHFGARYFDRYYHIADMPEKLDKARKCFMAQAKSWKPQEDADSYLTLTTRHSQIYCLAENELEYFTSGLYKKYADYVVAMCDNMGLASGFGDSGISSRPNLPQGALPEAMWWTDDGGYKWLLNHYADSDYSIPYDRGVEPVRPDRFTGINVFMNDPQVYEWMQKYPTYNETLVPAEVPFEDSFDKITFRENWEPDGQYLIVDGLARGKHLHYDANSIIEFVEDGERWLLDHDYLVRNTTEHTMLTVLRNGRCEELVPSMSGLSHYTDLPGFGYTDTYTKAYNGVNWRRQILWNRGEWFLVNDTVTPREDGEFDYEFTWKTIDNAGRQEIANGCDFIARRGPAALQTDDVTVVDDPVADGEQLAVMDRSTSRIAFGVDLPAGEYALDVIGYGIDGSSDSLWISVDLGENQMFGIPQGKLGHSAGDWALTTPTPNITLKGDGPHFVLVTLREKPPVRIDSFTFRAADGTATVLQAENLPSVPEMSASSDRILNIKPARPITAWVTNHEREGISVPISVLHQRAGGALNAGDSSSFASLVYTSMPNNRRTYQPIEIAPNLIAIKGDQPALALTGDVQTAAVRARVQAALLGTSHISISGLRRLSIGRVRLSASSPVDIDGNLGGDLFLTVPEGGAEIGMQVGGNVQTIKFDQGDQVIRASQVTVLADVARVVKEVVAGARAQSAAAASTEIATDAQPAWTALTDDSSNAAIKAADLGDGNGEHIYVCRGSQLICLNNAGTELWRFNATSLVRDVAFGNFRGDDAKEILIGSTDTFIYMLSPDGKLIDKHQMRGIPWARSFGDRPFSVYNVATADIAGDHYDEILVTMANYDLQALDASFNKLWGFDHALHGSMQLEVRDTNADNEKDMIFVGNKYGSATAIDFSGVQKYGRYTSIGDVWFATGDLDGDGKLDVVTASSTGDCVATPFDDSATTLWRFDNFGYPVNSVDMADLNGDGSDEVLIASGTGYLYALSGAGEVIWQDHSGLSVNNVCATERNGTPAVVYCDEAGMVRVADGQGNVIANFQTPSAPRYITITGSGAETLIAAALENGQVLAWPMP